MDLGANFEGLPWHCTYAPDVAVGYPDLGPVKDGDSGWMAACGVQTHSREHTQ